MSNETDCVLGPAPGRWVPNPATGGLTSIWKTEPLLIAPPTLRIRRQKRPYTRATCGTDAGYYRHTRRLNEPACDPCRVAHREAERRRRARAEAA